jgi:hypothetical protein
MRISRREILNPVRLAIEAFNSSPRENNPAPITVSRRQFNFSLLAASLFPTKNPSPTELATTTETELIPIPQIAEVPKLTPQYVLERVNDFFEYKWGKVKEVKNPFHGSRSDKKLHSMIFDFEGGFLKNDFKALCEQIKETTNFDLFEFPYQCSYWDALEEIQNNGERFQAFYAKHSNQTNKEELEKQFITSMVNEEIIESYDSDTGFLDDTYIAIRRFENKLNRWIDIVEFLNKEEKINLLEETSTSIDLVDMEKFRIKALRNLNKVGVKVKKEFKDAKPLVKALKDLERKFNGLNSNPDDFYDLRVKIQETKARETVREYKYLITRKHSLIEDLKYDSMLDVLMGAQRDYERANV